MARTDRTTGPEQTGSQDVSSTAVSLRGRLPISELLDGIKGRVITPDDEEYEAARTVFYGGIDARPAAIVRVADAGDVAHAILLARGAGLELAVRSGGHSLAGYGLSDGGLVIDLKEMRALQIDPESRTAWAETGLTTAEFTKAADAYGLAVGFGDTGSVGIGGITLGGGVGFLVRKYGMTIDSLLAAEMVTADGKRLYVDAQNHPDLFWAIRGGGGNFGVATRFKYRLRPLDRVVGGMLVLPATPETIAGFVAEAEAAPEDLSTIFSVMHAPPMPFLPAEVHGRLILWGFMVYAGDAEAGARVLAPFRALATPVVDMLRPMRYPEMYPPDEGSYHPTAIGYNMHLDHVDRETGGKILDRLQGSTSMRVAQIRVLGGAMARVPVDATAYAHRQCRIMVNLGAFYNGPEDRAVSERWLREFAAELDQGERAAYANFMADEGEERLRAAYPGATWDRLAAVKTRYDPTNFFRRNHNVPPAA